MEEIRDNDRFINWKMLYEEQIEIGNDLNDKVHQQGREISDLKEGRGWYRFWLIAPWVLLVLFSFVDVCGGK